MRAGKVRKAFRWSLAGTVGTEGIGLVLLVVLARLLTPADYGLAAIVGAMLAIGRYVAQAGFDRALVQSQQIDARDEATAFWANLTFGLLVGGLLAIASPAIAAFYGEPRLVAMLCVSSLQPPILAIALLQVALVERRLNFRLRSTVEIGANLGAAVLAVGMALAGCGAWCLIAQYLGYAVLRAGLLSVLHPWVPATGFSRGSFLRLWGFGWRYCLGQLIHAVFMQLHTLAIGRLFGVGEVGLYNRAKNIQGPLSSAIQVISGNVSFAALARIQDDRERLLASYRRIYRGTAAICGVAMCGLAGVAVPLVDVVLSHRWAAIAPLLQVFAAFGLCTGLAGQCSTLTGAIGRTDIMLRMTILQHILSVILLAITWRWGVQAVVMGLAIRAFVTLVVWSWVIRKLVDYHWQQQAADLLPALLAGLFAGAAAWSVAGILPWPTLPRLTIAIIAGAASWSLPFLLLRHRAFADLYQELLWALRLRQAPDARPPGTGTGTGTG